MGLPPLVAQKISTETIGQPAAVTFSGVVINAATGVPVSRALVRMNDRAMLTDHEGKFMFDQLTSSGSAVVEVRKPGFYASLEPGLQSIMLQGVQLTSPITLRLYPEALITGTITGPDGSPLSRVFVSALNSVYNETGHQWLPSGHSFTNSRGEFRLAVPPGDYRIATNFSPRVGGTTNAVLPLAVPSGQELIHMGSGTEQRFDLHPVVSQTYLVDVHIESSQERGFPNLLARSSDGSIFPVMVLHGEEAASGAMRVALPSGTFTLIASMNRGEVMEYGEANVTVADQNLSGLVLRMAPVAPIPVQIVVDPGSTSDKAPPSPQQLGLTMQNAQAVQIGTASFFVMARGNQEASFRPTPGVYRFTSRVTGSGWFIKSATYGTTDLLRENMTVTWGAGGSPIIVTVSNQTGGLQGSTRLKSTPASSWIDLIPNSPSAVPFYAGRSSADGAFSFPALPPGTYQVVSFESRHSANYRDPSVLLPYATYVRSVTINAGNKATIDLDAVPDTELHP
jgi:hypothetical protein